VCFFVLLCSCCVLHLCGLCRLDLSCVSRLCGLLRLLSLLACNCQHRYECGCEYELLHFKHSSFLFVSVKIIDSCLCAVK
jgi:hypothetical protein